MQHTALRPRLHVTLGGKRVASHSGPTFRHQARIPFVRYVDVVWPLPTRPGHPEGSAVGHVSTEARAHGEKAKSGLEKGRPTLSGHDLNSMAGFRQGI